VNRIFDRSRKSKANPADREAVASRIGVRDDKVAKLVSWGVPRQTERCVVRTLRASVRGEGRDHTRFSRRNEALPTGGGTKDAQSNQVSIFGRT
jgi:hypothetical protein